jgi:hypothetical protein
MSSFITAMDQGSLQTKGVNGSDVYSQPVGESGELLALFGALNRDLNKNTLTELMDSAKETSSVEDLFVLAYHVRDILEGKGERDLFYYMILHLYKTDPHVVIRLLQHVPHYGAWFDLQNLLEKALEEGQLVQREDDTKLEVNQTDPLVARVTQLYGDQLEKDDASTNSLSLAGKWMPRRNKKNGWLSVFVGKYLGMQEKQFRLLLSGLNKRLDTVEPKMCHDAKGEHHFSDIDPAKVPSLCLKKKRKGFFNEEKDGDIRFPKDVDRMACRDHFTAHMNRAAKGEAKVHGKTLMPHEFIIELEKGGNTANDLNTLQAQWNDLRDSTLAKGTLGKCVVMCDFSGSMCSSYGSVQPMHVSKGLGLLCAECTTPAFRDRILTFDSKPTWHNVSRYKTLVDRVNSFNGVSQGTSTNFQGAVDLVLNRLVEAKVPVGEEPDIILVLTDMGWDPANNQQSYYDNGMVLPKKNSGFQTHIDRIKKDFAAKGGWKVPTIVIWNVSGKFQEYHHKSDTEGVCVISGWSAAILKSIMGGEDIVEKLKNMTPYKMMRQVLDDPRYDPIRDSYKEI